MSAEGGLISYDLKEILEGINEKLAKNAVLAEQLDRRVSGVEARVAAHDRILTEQIPKFQKVIEDLNVQKQVEAALDSRRIKGVSNRDRFVVGALSACILLVTILAYLPHVLK